MPPTNKNANLVNKSVTPHKKKQSAVKEKKREAKKIATPPNRKGQKRKGKMVDMLWILPIILHQDQGDQLSYR
ncbi:hypothetical protein H5410_031723 [Solanum commersonii]|uniref:Uncharacterized protein n=1 Tax=Solanum commersonii TaxID=4109 RepID=A0A9J5YJ48_SOLCO|nr:hypothetical protein H5410_031723 [Solanum commersonii]